MSVGILIITHDGIGPALLGATLGMLDDTPLKIKLLSAGRDCVPEELLAEAELQMQQLDEGDGVLIITDMYGTTPASVARQLTTRGKARAVSGLNLPMLLRTLNDPRLDLARMMENALGGGKEGVRPVNGV